MTTAQEVFDKTVRHLFTQTGPSRDINGCLYRDRDHNRMCALGFWIPEEKYRHELEGAAIGMNDRLPEWFAVVTPEDIHPHYKLLAHLQHAHDNAVYHRLPEGLTWLSPKEGAHGIANLLRTVAQRLRLKPDVVQECWP